LLAFENHSKDYRVSGL